MSVAFAQEVVRATIELDDGTPRPVLVDTRAQKGVDRVAPEYLAEAAQGEGVGRPAELTDVALAVPGAARWPPGGSGTPHAMTSAS
ncbi:hypothetical protein [Sorangium sp. So ce1151]|uniref:hypothetical protein n=1 Tax=Sorangium sp. So ce1151 TaxID=3133332 RepID=UPI003F64456D